MLCPKCGNPIPEGSEICPLCQAALSTPTMEPLFQVAEVSPDPEASPVQDTPDFQLTSVDAEPKPKKKLSGGRIALIISALVVLVSTVLVICNWQSIKGWYYRNWGDSEDYFEYVETNTASAVASDVSDLYGNVLSLLNNKEISSDRTVTLTLSPSAKSFLPSEMNWVESISLHCTSQFVDNIFAAELDISLNDTHIGTICAILDPTAQTLYLGVPELSETYLAVDLSPLLSQMDIDSSVLSMLPLYGGMLQSMLPSPEQVEGILTSLLTTLIDEIPEVTKTETTCTLDGVSQKAVALRVDLTQRDVVEIICELLESVKENPNIESMLGGGLPFAGGAYDGFTQGIDALLQEMARTEADNTMVLSMVSYVDENHNVIGRTITLYEDGQHIDIRYLRVNDGSRYADILEIPAPEANITFSGSGTVSGGKRTGEYTLSVNGTPYLSLQLQNFSESDCTGIIRLSLGSGLISALGLDSNFSKATLAITLEKASTQLSLEILGVSMATMTFTEQPSTPKPVTIPDSIDTDNNAALDQWASGLDINQLLTALQKAGIPSELLSGLLAEMASI